MSTERAALSRFISARNWPRIEECITPWPEEPLTSQKRSTPGALASGWRVHFVETAQHPSLLSQQPCRDEGRGRARSALDQVLSSQPGSGAPKEDVLKALDFNIPGW